MSQLTKENHYSLLSDKNTYKPLGYNPTSAFRKTVSNFTSTLFSKGVIKADFKRKLDPPSEPIVPKFYGLPKIHKSETIPVRPIIRITSRKLLATKKCLGHPAEKRRPSNPHGLTVRLTVWDAVSRLCLLISR